MVSKSKTQKTSDLYQEWQLLGNHQTFYCHGIIQFNWHYVVECPVCVLYEILEPTRP